MFAARRRRSLSVVGLSAALAVPLLGLPGTAVAADEPSSGDTVIGTLVQAWPEYEQPSEVAEHGDEGPLSWIEVDAGSSVRVPTEDVESIPVGSVVEVTLGSEVADPAAEEMGMEPALDVLDATVVEPAATDAPPAAAAGTITNEVTVVRVLPAVQATADPQTVAGIVDVINGEVAQFWNEQSDGDIRIRATGWAEWVPVGADCSDPFGMWAEAAAAVGFQRAPGKHLLLYVSRTGANFPGCADGLATVGSSTDAGGYLYTRFVAPSIMAHELGHNFGLGHSSARQCDGFIDSGTCRTDPYRDWYDVMGVSWDRLGSLNAPHAARLGVLPTAESVRLAAGLGGGTYRLVPMVAASGTRAIELTDSRGVAYWLEYRAASGRDAWLGTSENWPQLQTGVVLRQAASGRDTSLILDGSPSSPSQWDQDMQVALPVSTPVPIARGDFTITVQNVSSGGADVRVATASSAGSYSSDPASGDVGGRGSGYFLNDSFSGQANRTFSYGDAADRVFIGDWDGDGIDTLMIRRGNIFYIRNSLATGRADYAFAFGDPGDVVLAGDWNGDGADSLVVRRGYQYFVRNSLTTGTADFVFGYGDPRDVVLIADWDGDGDDSLGVRRGAHYLVKYDVTTGFADRTFAYGEPNDTVLVGRWSSGQTGESLAVRRGNQYHLRYSLTSGVANQVVAYGEATDTAFAGDWNGDSLDTLGVRR